MHEQAHAQYISFASWQGATSSEPCEGSPTVGTVCTDGSVYAGLSPDGNVPMFVTRCDLGQTWSGSTCTGTRTTPTWNDGTTGWLNTTLANCSDETGGTGAPTGTGTCINGKSNSATLITIDSSTSSGINPHNAALACENLNLHGKTDWYLPSELELWGLYPNRVAIGNLLTDGSNYWSSSEYFMREAWIVRFSDGYRNNPANSKDDGYYIRCARR